MANAKQLLQELKDAGLPAIGASDDARVALSGERVVLPGGGADPGRNPIDQQTLDDVAAVVAAHVPAAVVPRDSLLDIVLALVMKANPGGGPLPQWASDALGRAETEGRGRP